MAIKNSKELQTRLFEQVKQLISPNLSLADEIAELLNISTDSVYRRMRCETDVSVDEAALICKHFKVSIDSLFSSQSDLVSFTYKSFATGKLSFEIFLKSIIHDLDSIASFKSKQIYFSNTCINYFFNKAYFVLARIKLFCYCSVA